MKVIEKNHVQTEQNSNESTSETKKRAFKLSGYWRFTIIFAAVIVSLNLLSRIKVLSDFYDDNIFRYISQPYCRLTGLFPFSVGEVLIPIAMLIVLAAVITLILLPFFKKEIRFS